MKVIFLLSILMLSSLIAEERIICCDQFENNQKRCYGKQEIINKLQPLYKNGNIHDVVMNLNWKPIQIDTLVEEKYNRSICVIYTKGRKSRR